MKVPKAVQEPTGKWYIRLRLKNEDGDMMTYAVRENTEKKAIDKALAIKAGIKADTVAEKRKKPDKTLEKAIDEYISRRSNVLSPSTIRGYNSIKESRFKDVMEKRIGDVSDWQAVVNDEAALCSAKTLKNSWLLIKSVLKENGVDADVSLPPVPKPEKKWLTPDQCLVFAEAVKGKKCEIGALLALNGLRRSEIFGLTWDNVNLQKETVTVKGAVVVDKDNNPVRKKTNKTYKSARTVSISTPSLLEALKAEKDKTGVVAHGSIKCLYKDINRICGSAGLPLVGVHGLRHSYASLCYHLGIPELETMKRGGWSNVATVHEIYTHISEGDEADSDVKLKNFFKNGK